MVHLSVFVDLLCFAIILPLLPLYALELDATGFEVGALLSCYAIAQLIGAPLLGRLSDRVGRRPVLVMALTGTAISMALTGWATSLPALLLARTVAGAFGGSISAAQAWLADVTRPEDRARAMGLLGASIGFGFVAGPALGAFLAPWGFAAASYVAAAIAALNAVGALFYLEEPERDRSAGSTERPSLVALGSPRPISMLLAAGFLSTAAFVAVETAFPLVGERLWAMDGRDLGFVFTFVGVVSIVVQGGLVGRLERAWGRRKSAILGTIIMACGLAAMGRAGSLGMLEVVSALGLVAAGQGLVRPALAAMLSLEAGESHRGEVLGLGQSAAAAARALGPLGAGLLYDRALPLPFMAGAVAIVAVMGILAAWRPGRPAASAERLPREGDQLS